MSYILTISTSTEVFKLVEHAFAEKAPAKYRLLAGLSIF